MKFTLLLTGCVLEAGSPGHLGRLAPNLVEMVLEPGKGRNFDIKALLFIIACRRTCSDAECTEFKDRGYNVKTLAFGAAQMDNNCNPHACPSMELKSF